MSSAKCPAIQLRHRITLSREVQTEDGYGGQLTQWQDVGECWAQITPYLGRKGFDAGVAISQTTHQIRLRFRDDLTADMRILYRERSFEIIDIINEKEVDQFLLVEAKERT